MQCFSSIFQVYKDTEELYAGNYFYLIVFAFFSLLSLLV